MQKSRWTPTSVRLQTTYVCSILQDSLTPNSAGVAARHQVICGHVVQFYDAAWEYNMQCAGAMLQQLYGQLQRFVDYCAVFYENYSLCS